MPLNLKFAIGLLVASALVAAGNAWAMRAFSQQWGGPNIGGGVIQLAAYTGIVVGAVLVVMVIVRRRRERPTR